MNQWALIESEEGDEYTVLLQEMAETEEGDVPRQFRVQVIDMSNGEMVRDFTVVSKKHAYSLYRGCVAEYWPKPADPVRVPMNDYSTNPLYGRF